MNSKIVLSFSLCIVFVLVSAGGVQAESSSSGRLRPVKMMAPDSTGAGKMEKKTENSLERLKKKANKELERRIKALTHLITVINKFQKVSAEQKASLTAQVQTQIDALTALRAKINADTDLATLRVDVASIKKDYRIFALFIPKIHIMANADRLLETIQKASTLADNLEKRIEEEKTKGTDVSALESLLISMRSHLAEAKTQTESALSTVTPLTPEGYPANQAELKKAREMLRLGHAQLVLARQDGRKIMQAFGIVVEVTPSASVTLEPTP